MLHRQSVDHCWPELERPQEGSQRRAAYAELCETKLDVIHKVSTE